MSRHKLITGVVILAGLAFVAIGLLAVAPALAGEPEQKSTADVNWTFSDPGYSSPAGTSSLIRTNNGISARYSTSGLIPGSTATLWFIVFNNPNGCLEVGACGLDDLGDTAAQGDFLLASGQVIGSDGKATFGGYLREGDVSGSGLHEVACSETKDCGIGLQDAENALVVLALHSHGPAMEGQVLKDQISSFTGGCEVFLDEENNGFANDPDDIPILPGECSTMQMSPHAP